MKKKLLLQIGGRERNYFSQVKSNGGILEKFNYPFHCNKESLNSVYKDCHSYLSTINKQITTPLPKLKGGSNNNGK